jgi:hypothetical protein
MQTLSEFGKMTGSDKRLHTALLDIAVKYYGVNAETIRMYQKTISMSDLLDSGEKGNTIRKELKTLERKMKIKKLKSKI